MKLLSQWNNGVGLRARMGWGGGCGKAEVINPAAGDCVACGVSEHHPFHGKTVLIDISGLAHKAAKRDARTVVHDGTSLQQQEYVQKRLHQASTLETRASAFILR